MTRTGCLLPLATLLLAALLTACTGGPPPAHASDPSIAPPEQWQAPLPHEGKATDLARWWQQFEDPLLAEMMAAAQDASPTIASAQARIAQARANRVSANATLLPSLDATAGASRGTQDLSLPIANTASAGLQASWEIDLFGGNRAGRDAAGARLAGAEAGWHEARVAVAAELASTYLQLRACEAQLEKVRADVESRQQTARLTEIAAQAGFQAPAASALARASAAQGNSAYLQLKAQCDGSVKSLVALTGFPEPELRARLASGTGTLPMPALIAVGTVPADVLNQRPDLYIAAREVEAASADVSQARAARWPRVSLSGSFGRMRLETSAATIEGATWAAGPLSISLPLFDGGTRRANVDAARARYDEAAVTYRASVRGAVREVEQALVQLDSAEARRNDARTAAEGFETSYRAVEARYRGGIASLFELEDARRSALLAQVSLVDLERDRVAAWITLYRALGGGWTPVPPKNS